MYDNFEDNNDIGSFGIYDDSIFTQKMQAGSDETALGVSVGDFASSDADINDSLSIFQVDENGYLLVKDTDLYNLFTEFTEDYTLTSEGIGYLLLDLDKDIKILTGVVLILGFGFFMRLIIRRVFGRWF